MKWIQRFYNHCIRAPGWWRGPISLSTLLLSGSWDRSPIDKIVIIVIINISQSFIFSLLPGWNGSKTNFHRYSGGDFSLLALVKYLCHKKIGDNLPPDDHLLHADDEADDHLLHAYDKAGDQLLNADDEADDHLLNADDEADDRLLHADHLLDPDDRSAQKLVSPATFCLRLKGPLNLESGVMLTDLLYKYISFTK